MPRVSGVGIFPHNVLTHAAITFALVTLMGVYPVDVIFILVIGVLYAATHWLAWAVSRLGETE